MNIFICVVMPMTFFNECAHPVTNGATETYDTLVHNYLEIMTEIERRISHE